MVKELVLFCWTMLPVQAERLASLIVVLTILEFTTVTMVKMLGSYVLLSLFLDLVRTLNQACMCMNLNV